MKAISRIHRQTAVNEAVVTWLRRYFIAVGLVALGCAGWKYNLFIHTYQHVGRTSFQTWVLALDAGSYLLVLVLLLAPWWKFGDVLCALGYAIALPAGVYLMGGLSIVDLLYLHQQTLLHFILLSAVLAQVVWLFIPIRAKSRQATIAYEWKQRLRRDHKEERDLVEKFIREIEGADQDLDEWTRFAAGIRHDDPMAMWKRLDQEWGRWLESMNRNEPGKVH